MAELAAAIAEIDDTAVLNAILEHDTRSGARLAAEGRLALLPGTAS